MARKNSKPAPFAPKSFADLDAAGLGLGYQGSSYSQSVEEEKPKERTSRTWGEAFSDTGAQLAEGVNNLAGAVPNLVAPQSGVAEFFRGNADSWREKQSPVMQRKIADAEKEISKADQDSIIDQVVAAAKAYSSDPALAARFVTTNLPSMLPGVGVAKVAQAAKLASGASAAAAAATATTAAGATNAVLNAGGARGEAFEDIKDTLVKQGLSPEQAEEQALKSSRLPAAVGGLAGFVSGKMGLEKAVVGKGLAAGGVRAGAASMAGEMVGEQLEEVAPKLATNYQASEFDGRPMSRDVGRTIAETAIASGPMAGVSGVMAGMNHKADGTPVNKDTAPANPEAAPVNDSATPANAAVTPANVEQALQVEQAAKANPEKFPDGTPQTMPLDKVEARLAELEISESVNGLSAEQQAEKNALGLRVAEEREAENARENVGESAEEVTPAPTIAPEDAPDAGADVPTTSVAAEPESLGLVASEESNAKTWPQYVAEHGLKVSSLNSKSPEWATLKSGWDALKVKRAGQNPTGNGSVGQSTPEIQNRDRARPASVMQMQGMAANPDYLRLGVSRSPETGAPMVFSVGDQPTAAQAMGRSDTAVMSDGQRVPFQYAVMEASDVQPSNFADGSVNPMFDAAHPGTVKALNNGRTAGLRAAYERGTAENYKRELMADADLHGIDPAVIEGMNSPMLVRLYSEKDNQSNMGAKSQSQALGLSASEQAATDAELVDASVVSAFETGELDSAGNRDFARAFVGKLMENGQDVAGMMDGNGSLSQAGKTRLQAAMVHKAYGDGDLVETLFSSNEGEIRAIGESLKDIAGEWAVLRQAAANGSVNPQVDVTGNLMQAVSMVQRARREKSALYDAINQVDIETGDVVDPLTVGMLRLLYSGEYLTRAVGREKLTQSLREYMAAALATTAESDMFGEQIGPNDIFNALNGNPNGNNESNPQPTEGQRVTTGSDTASGSSVEAGPAEQRQEPNRTGQEADEDGRRGQGQDAQDSTQLQDGEGNQGDGENGSGPVSPELELSSYTKEEGRAQQEAQEKAEKQKAAEEAKAEADAKAERERKEIAARQDASAENFQLGQDPMDSLTGQESIFDAPKTEAKPEAKKPTAKTQVDQTETPAFKKWFGESKVVDSDGKPLPMYHGTSGNQDGDAFTFFDTYASNYGLMGMGGYFTADPSVASSYTEKGKGDTPTVYQVFLSIKNPLDMDAKADAAAWKKQFPDAADFHEGGSTNESWYRAAEDALSEEGLPKWEGAEVMQDGLRAMGFDGITHIGGGRVKSDGVKHRVYITFEPEQTKSATGNNGEFDPAKSDIRFSRAANTIDPDKNLILVHNLSAQNLLHADELGGLPAPSLAVANVDAPLDGFGEITLIGDAAMATPSAKNPIFDADVYSPRFPSIDVKVDAKLVRKALAPLQEAAQKMGLNMRPADGAIEDMERNRLGDAIGRFSYDNTARLAFANVVLGKKLKVPMKDKPVAVSSGNLISQSPLREYLQGKTHSDIANLTPEESKSVAVKAYAAMINKTQADATASGEKVSFDETMKLVNQRIKLFATTSIPAGSVELQDDLVTGLSERGVRLIRNMMAEPQTQESSNAPSQEVDYTALTALVDKEVPREAMDDWLREQFTPAMGEKKIAKDNGRKAAYTLDNIVKEMTRKVRDAEGFNYGLGNARSKGATKFKNLRQIQDKRDRVVSSEQFEAARKEIDAEFSQLVDAVQPFQTYERDSAFELLAEAIGNSYAKPLGQALEDAALKGVPADLQKRIGEFAAALVNAPTNYFEAKPQRAVGFNEFKGAVIPSSTAPEVRAALEKHGLTLQEYDSSVEGARAAAVRALADKMHADSGDVRFKRGKDGKPTTPSIESDSKLKAATDTVNAIKKAWANAPEVIIARNLMDEKIPSEVRHVDESMGGQARGFFYGGKVYLLSDHLPDTQAVTETLFHETLGHFGLRGVFGEALYPVLNQIITARGKEIKAKAEAYGIDLSTKAGKLEAAEEVLAEMAQTHPELGFVQRAVAAIRTWMRKNVPGFAAMNLSDDEIVQNFLVPAREFVVRGKSEGASSVDAEARFNRLDQTETEAFKKWFGDSPNVDSDGKPVIFYHGGSEDFSQIKSGRFGSGIFVREGQPSGYGVKQHGLYLNKPILELDGLSDELDSDKGREVLAKHLRTNDEDAISSVAEALAENEIYPESPEVWELIGAIDEADAQKEIQTLRGKVAKDLGYSAVRQPDEFDGETVMIVDPTAIKSATENNGSFDPANPDIRFSRTPSNQPGQPQSKLTQLQNKAKGLVSRERMDWMIYNMQDKFIDLKRIQQQIKDLGGTVSELNDAYKGEELYHKRVAKRTENFLRDEVRPLLQGLGKAKVTIEEFEKFLHARHAGEANAKMAERNPNQTELDAKRLAADAEVKKLRNALQHARANNSSTVAIQKSLALAIAEQDKWNSAQAFKGTEEQRMSLSGMSDAEANQILTGYPADKLKDLNDLAARVDKINEGTLNTLDQYGLMDKKTLKAWRDEYKHYVPLHRDEAHPDSKAHPIGQGFSTKGDAAKQRVGSNEKVTNILSHVLMQRESALTRGEKNNVVKRLYLLASQNPDENLWSFDLPKKKVVDPDTGLVRTVPDHAARLQDNVLSVRIGGQDKHIIFNARNEQAMRLGVAMKNLDAAELDLMTRSVGKVTRFMAAMNTQYNPVFSVMNLMRDVQGVALQLTNTQLAGKQKDVLKLITPKNWNALMQDLRSARKNPHAPKSSWVQLFEQFQLDGGATGYRDLYADPADRAKSLNRELKKTNGDRAKALKVKDFILDNLSDFNESLENITRLATYKVALDNGLSRQEAASIAKNITVNFNRKGVQTSKLGAHYAFLNAAIQGNKRLYETMSGPAGKKIAMGGVALGAMSALMGQFIMGGGDGADDEWKKIPEFVKERSIIIPLGRKDYVAIPLPLGFHVLPNVGRKSVDMLLNNDPTKSRASYVGDLALITANAFNPLGGTDNISQMLAPTWLDPFVGLMSNKDWTGRQIYREDMSGLDPTPGHTRVKDGTANVYRWLSEGLNTLSGGNEWKPGAYSPTPEALAYLTESFLGGVGREANKVGAMITAGIEGEELAAKDIVFFGRIYGNTKGVTNQSPAYYDNLKSVHVAMREAKGRIEKGEDYDAVLADMPIVQANATAKAIEKNVSQLTKMRRAVQAGDTPDKREVVKQINEQIEQQMYHLNQVVDSALKAKARE